MTEHNENDIEAHILGLLVDKYNVAAEDATPTARFCDLDIDSMTLMEIELTIQRRFGFPMPDGLLDADHTVQQAAAAASSAAHPPPSLDHNTLATG